MNRRRLQREGIEENTKKRVSKKAVNLVHFCPVKCKKFESEGNILRKKKGKEFNLFGYFKNDPSRKIWFLFRSVNFKKKENVGIRTPRRHNQDLTIEDLQCYPLISFSQVNHLETESPTFRYVKTIVQRANDNEMIELRKLIFRFSFFDSCKTVHETSKLFMNPNSLPNLRALEITSDSHLVDSNGKCNEIGSGWNLLRKPFSSLDAIRISMTNLSNLNLFSSTTENQVCVFHLKVVHIADLDMTFRPVIVDSPYLMELELVKCKHLTFNNCKSLRYLYLEKCDSVFADGMDTDFKAIDTDLRNMSHLFTILKNNSDHLEELIISGSKTQEKVTSLFLNFSYRNLKHLALKNLEWSSELFVIIERFQLESITFRDIKNFPLGLLTTSTTHNFKNIKKLEICRPSSFFQQHQQLNYFWPISKQLESLKLKECDNFFNDRIFYNNEFNELQDLHIQGNFQENEVYVDTFENMINTTTIINRMFPKLTSCPSSSSPSQNSLQKFSGMNWKYLPNLRKLKVENTCMKDELFISDIFPNLEELTIKGNNKLTGRRWSRLECLRVLVVEDCFGITDRSFFSVFEFPKLECLELRCMLQLTGENWMRMDCLKYFDVEACNVRKQDINSNSHFLYIEC